ncbi:MAG TPA: hypothetical protein VGG33_00785 [Polyangia bacterium]
MLALGSELRAWEVRAHERLRSALAVGEPLEFLGVAKDFDTFVGLFDAIDLRDGTNLHRMKDGSIYVGEFFDLVRLQAERPTSHLLITGLNENWGALSMPIPNRTVDWGRWEDHLSDAGCTLEMVHAYLDDPAVKAVVTPHHTILWHPTVISLPVGVSWGFMQRLGNDPLTAMGVGEKVPRKTQELLINNSGWAHREQVNQRVIANFGGRIENTFGLNQRDFFASVVQARFVLCPSGLGWDTSRIWETLTLGSIPILEYTEGWHTALDDLPALFVTNFDEVTPALLARAYPEILSRCEQFDYGRLTTRWWVDRITKALHR